MSTAGDISGIRTDYRQHTLSETDVDADPFRQFGRWWNEAVAGEVDEPNAMTLATASTDGLPAARIVLLKDFDERGFVFYTNYDSFKGKQLEENPRACLVFFWRELERQVRITGLVTRTAGDESDTYFRSRPLGSRLGAWASPQSQVIESQAWLEARETSLRTQYPGEEIPRPPHWGGYRVTPVTIEFWQGRPNRLHDRLQYSLEESGSWKIERLAP